MKTDTSGFWDDLYVVAENQMGGWEACDVTDGVLQTYANQADAEREAQMTIDDLNSMVAITAQLLGRASD